MSYLYTPGRPRKNANLHRIELEARVKQRDSCLTDSSASNRTVRSSLIFSLSISVHESEKWYLDDSKESDESWMNAKNVYAMT